MVITVLVLLRPCTSPSYNLSIRIAKQNLQLALLEPKAYILTHRYAAFDMTLDGVLENLSTS